MPDRLGAERPYLSPFIVNVSLRHDHRVGRPRPPSARYSAKLDYDRSDYEISVPISHSLEAGEADRFTLTVFAERSSSHSFEGRPDGRRRGVRAPADGIIQPAILA
jgi:hypothetical protein